MSGAADAASLGLADPVMATAKALMSRSQGPLLARIQRNLEAERAQDRADAKRYGASRMIGQGLGTVGAIVAGEALLPIAAAGATAARFVPSAGRLVKNTGHVFKLGATSGGAAGFGGQVVSDTISGDRPSVKRYLASTAGGALGGVAAPVVGITKGGAVAGATTPALLAIAEGRAPSMSEISAGAMTGAFLGRLGGARAAKTVSSLPPKAKGALGERLSKMTPRADKIVGSQERHPLSDYDGIRGYTRADWTRQSRKPLESKFGPTATLGPRQIQAQRELGANYLVEHWLPRDVGAMTGVGAASSGVNTIFDLPDVWAKQREALTRR